MCQTPDAPLQALPLGWNEWEAACSIEGLHKGRKKQIMYRFLRLLWISMQWYTKLNCSLPTNSKLCNNYFPVLLSWGRDVSAPLPGLWCAMSRHCPACRLWEEMNVEYHVSISFRWLGMSGLNTITTPLESFSKAGQHVSNL